MRGRKSSGGENRRNSRGMIRRKSRMKRRGNSRRKREKQEQEQQEEREEKRKEERRTEGRAEGRAGVKSKRKRCKSRRKREEQEEEWGKAKVQERQPPPHPLIVQPVDACEEEQQEGVPGLAVALGGQGQVVLEGLAAHPDEPVLHRVPGLLATLVPVHAEQHPQHARQALGLLRTRAPHWLPATDSCTAAVARRMGRYLKHKTITCKLLGHRLNRNSMGA